MNSLNLTGRIVQEIEVKYVGQKDTPMVRNSIAVPKNFDREKVNFINITIFGQNAENFKKVVDKGDLVAITSELTVDDYENKDGEKRTSFYALVDKWELCRKKKENNNNEREDIPEDIPTEDK